MESCNHWICPNTICLQLLRLYRWAHGWWMMEEEVVLCVCLLFSHVLGWIQRDLCCGVCMRLPILDCRPYSECKKCVGVDWGSISAARLLFSSLWNLLIMCSFVKPVFYSSPVYISCSETIAPLLKSVNWMSLVVVGEKLSVEATVKFSIIKVSIITMLGKMFCFYGWKLPIGNCHAISIIKTSFGSSEYINRIFRTMPAVPIGDLSHADFHGGIQQAYNHKHIGNIPLSV